MSSAASGATPAPPVSGTTTHRGDSSSTAPPLPPAQHPTEKILGKVREQLAKEQGQQGGPAPPLVVLIATGSLCPVHYDHVGIFTSAKNHLERHHGCVVVGGLLSPSHDRYLRGKLGNKAIPAVHRSSSCLLLPPPASSSPFFTLVVPTCRVRICELAVQESDWIGVDAWEMSQPDFVDFPQVARHLLRHLEGTEGLPRHRMRVFFLCGADLALKCGLDFRRLSDVGVVVAGRLGESNEVLREKSLPEGIPVTKESRNELVYFPTEMQDISSTLIRERMARGEGVDHLTYPQVVNYMQQQQLIK